NGGSVKLAVRHAATRLQLEDEIRALDPAAYPVLVQQRIVGPGVGIFLLLWNGELIATFSHRRLREKPPAGGVSVYRESIAANPALVARSRALLGLFAWRGVAMIEYKLDAATGTPYLMEVNGRFWGSLQLAIDAGVDFPVLLTQAALDERPTPVSHYKTGVRSRWWWGDVDHLMARLRRTDVELSLPPGLPGRLGTLRDFFTLWRPGDRNEVLRFGDPAPFIRETIEWMHRR
ncbi:MAG: ATP-grasp domain-containing protein, partial [Gemmatimonadota bacterium]|nr:ATP-grasp domain-containing protein [Gemmatimonadota bacterium]